MAITKTTVVKRVDVTVRDATDYTQSVLSVTLIDTWDDPEDADLPIRKSRVVNLPTGTDVTSYPQFVQDIAGTVWGS
jgi:hypothetical protein